MLLKKLLRKAKLVEATKTAKSCSQRQKLPSTIGTDLKGATSSCDTQSKPQRKNLVVQGWVRLSILIIRTYLRETL